MSDMPGPDQLLADADWLRRLALAVAGSPDDAEDVLQESRIAAWRSAPDTSRPMRPWLAKVIRDVAGMRKRSAARRQTREIGYEPQPAAAPDELLEQMRLHRLLVDLVMELEEPYRATVIARFVEGRSAAAIARSAGIPESTVRGRLREALARLRAALDEKRGTRKAWAPAVLAFARGGVHVAKPAKSVLIVIAILALVLGLIVIGLAWRDPPQASHAVVATTGARPASANRGPPSDVVAKLVASGQAPGWMVQAGAPSRRLAGTVLVDGAPTAGILVRVTSELSSTGLLPVLEQRSDSAGRFDFGVQLPREVVVGAAAPERLAAIRHVDLRDPDVRSDQIELALTSCVVAFFGKTLDASGGPIAHARLLREDTIGAESDAQGNYELCVPPNAAQVEQLEIVVRADGYGAISVVAAPVGRVPHDFVLTPEAIITGRAVLPDGTPAAHAQIWAEADDAAGRPDEQTAHTVTAADEQGQFKLAGLAGGRIRLGGLGRGVAARPAIVVVTAGESKHVTLAMTAEGIVRGRVMRDGHPVAGARVATMTERSPSAMSQADGTFVLDRVPAGDTRFVAPPYLVRAPASLRVTTGERNTVTLEVESLGTLRGTVRHRQAAIANAVVRVHGPTRHVVTADAGGRFELAGLLPGDYKLYAHDARRGAATIDVTFALAAAETRTLDLELVIHARIGGTVVDARGAPIAGALVKLASDDGDLGRCLADARGAFTCGEMLGARRYTPTVFPAAGSAMAFPFAGPAPSIELAGNTSEVTGVRLVVDAARAEITGTVVDRDGDPIADARVRALTDNLGGDLWMPSPRGLTATDGTFRIAGLVPGTYLLEVRTRDGSTSLHPKIATGTKPELVVGPTCMHEKVTPDVRTRPRSRVVFDDAIELVGWTLPDKVTVGEEVTVTFAYRVLRPVDRSWKIFVHLGGTRRERGQWFNFDHDPMAGRCPTALWKPGDLIVDRFSVLVDGTDKTGPYQVWTGFFVGSFGRWRNLTVTEAPSELRDNDDRLKIATVTVQ